MFAFAEEHGKVHAAGNVQIVNSHRNSLKKELEVSEQNSILGRLSHILVPGRSSNLLCISSAALTQLLVVSAG